jgi:plasmid stability protein
MTTINLDNLSENIRYQLEQRAAIHGCSVESELDSILKTVFEQKSTDNSLKELLLAMPDVGEDADFDCVRDNSRKILL